MTRLLVISAHPWSFRPATIVCWCLGESAPSSGGREEIRVGALSARAILSERIVMKQCAGDLRFVHPTRIGEGHHEPGLDAILIAALAGYVRESLP